MTPDRVYVIAPRENWRPLVAGMEAGRSAARVGLSREELALARFDLLAFVDRKLRAALGADS